MTGALHVGWKLDVVLAFDSDRGVNRVPKPHVLDRETALAEPVGDDAHDERSAGEAEEEYLESARSRRMVQEPVLVVVDDGHRIRAKERSAEMPERMRPRPRLEIKALVPVLDEQVIEPAHIRPPPVNPLPRPLGRHHQVHIAIIPDPQTGSFLPAGR